jgi:hypothetical protein
MLTARLLPSWIQPTHPVVVRESKVFAFPNDLRTSRLSNLFLSYLLSLPVYRSGSLLSVLAPVAIAGAPQLHHGRKITSPDQSGSSPFYMVQQFSFSQSMPFLLRHPLIVSNLL